MTGYIKLYRQIVDWEWYDDINMSRLFIHLLLKANFQDARWKGVLVKKGSLITSLDSLSQQTGLSIQNVRTCLTRLKKSKEITIKTTSKFRIITVVSYDLYQSDNKQVTGKQQATNNQVTSNQQTNNKQLTTTKEVKEVKKEKDNLKVIQKGNSKKASRFNAERDFSTRAILPSDFLEYAMNNGFSANDASEHFQNFADYWESVPGNKGLKLDWLATWRNWLRRSGSFAPRQGSQQQQKSKYEAIQEFTDLVNADPRSHIRPKSKYAYLSEIER
ncbi:MAG: hypothetical protein GY793_03360 [Proteobacteria bacterium]|nr:hypothetical protein [Pseudomonadota bacterium]